MKLPLILALALVFVGAGCAEIRIESKTTTDRPYLSGGTLPPKDEKKISQIMNQAQGGGWPLGSFEINHTGGHDAVKDIRIFVITDVEIDHGGASDCLVAFWKDDARPVGFSCLPPR